MLWKSWWWENPADLGEIRTGNNDGGFLLRHGHGSHDDEPMRGRQTYRTMETATVR